MNREKAKIENRSSKLGTTAVAPQRANFEFRVSNFVMWVMASLALVSFCAMAHAQGQNFQPQLLRDVGIDQKLNDAIPLDLSFRDEAGQPVLLRSYFDGKPVVLAMVYYQCPMLCTEVLNGLLHSLQAISMDAGREFNVVIVSIDPRETPGLAATKNRIYAGLYGRPRASEGWHFLTGDEPSIENLAHAVGFRYAYDAPSGQFAHPSAIMVLTPAGRLSRYFYGIEYPPRDVRLGLVEAARGKIGTPVDQILLYCYHYDPRTGRYGLVIFNVIRAAGFATAVILAAFLAILFRRERAAGARAERRVEFRGRWV